MNNRLPSITATNMQFDLVDVSYGAHKVIDTFDSFDRAIDVAARLLNSGDYRFQIIREDGLIRWDSRD